MPKYYIFILIISRGTALAFQRSYTRLTQNGAKKGTQFVDSVDDVC